jgi:hypothetical protein
LPGEHCVPGRPAVTVSRADGARYLCNDCGRDLTGVGLVVACRCGSAARRRIDAGDASYRRPATGEAPRWNPLKDWTAKYLQFTWNVSQLRRLYAPGSGADAVEVRRIVDMSFASGLSLGEWLTAGPEPVTVTPGDVARLVGAEPLSVCVALGRADEPAARIIPVGFVRPPHFWVEYRRPNSRPVRFDALDLAERCLQAWQTFLTIRGVELPAWPG